MKSFKVSICEISKTGVAVPVKKGTLDTEATNKTQFLDDAMQYALPEFLKYYPIGFGWHKEEMHGLPLGKVGFRIYCSGQHTELRVQDGLLKMMDDSLPDQLFEIIIEVGNEFE